VASRLFTEARPWLPNEKGLGIALVIYVIQLGIVLILSTSFFASAVEHEHDYVDNLFVACHVLISFEFFMLFCYLAFSSRGFFIAVQDHFSFAPQVNQNLSSEFFKVHYSESNLL